MRRGLRRQLFARGHPLPMVLVAPAGRRRRSPPAPGRKSAVWRFSVNTVSNARPIWVLAYGASMTNSAVQMRVIRTGPNRLRFDSASVVVARGTRPDCGPTPTLRSCPAARDMSR